ncbi:tetratricopeptide repeat-containing diguanylate cyclase [Vibrio sp. TH_r3]|uniref:tetratricopeptide repeat-containing diguanylate cyclase n=1 Tax=Vibrio sp. TH_r3 TaxID=3082084 RepID=UPI002955B6F2|nr:tetratricopeptide repeat-containing diguanylate cyclase [Vibrio sp. TH_r3]MDV7104925.1 tetratricopeptide repeat-containing diguanylate cyclase [Vibrio sp. TH_r3]
MRFILTLILICYISTVNAKENSSLVSVNIAEDKSYNELLNKHLGLNSIDEIKTIELAKQALSLSMDNNQQLATAEVSVLLGDLILQSQDIVQSIQHYVTASVIYKKLDDNRLTEVTKKIDQLLPLAKELGKSSDIALLLAAKSDEQYQLKQYNLAVVLYLRAVNYLLEQDAPFLKKQLGVTYTSLAQSYKRLNSRVQTAWYYKQALAVFRQLDNKKYIARTLNTLAEAERKLENYLSSLDYSVESIELHKQINDPVGHAKALTGAGIIYRYIELYEKSLNYMYEAHQFYKKANMISDVGKTSNQMGLIYTRLKEFEQARSFYQLTIDLPEEKVEPSTLASALREMAVIETKAHNYNTAKVLAFKASKIYQDTGDRKNQALIARIIGNIYRDKVSYPQAIDYYRESLSIATEIGNKLYQAKAQTPLAAMLFSTDLDESILLLNKAVRLSTEINDNAQKLYAYRELRKAEKLRGNYSESLRYAELEIIYSGILQKERENKQLDKLKATLYSQKIEMELESLKEKAERDRLELAKKSSEMELVKQAKTIAELELKNNKYSNIALGSLLVASVILIIMVCFKFIASKKRNLELGYLAARDPLTNCYNRRTLLNHLEMDFQRLEDIGDYSIIMADIDHFKKVNDTYGHVTGDRVLCQVVETLQHCVRAEDIVARYGGEEFCIVLQGLDAVKAAQIAEKMRCSIEHTNYNGVSVTCSFGVTTIRFNASDPNELIAQADSALYQAKSSGRNSVVLWSE